MSSKNGFIAMSAGALVVLMLGFHTYNLSTERSAKAHRVELLEDEVRDFRILRTYLMEQVDSLQQAYETLAKENKASLASSSVVTQQKLAEKAAIIKYLETGDTSSKDLNVLKSKVDGLLKLKALLERDIADLSPPPAQRR